MRRGYLPFLLLLSALWGASYLFIKLGVLEMEPAFMVMLRFWLAAAVLLTVLVVSVGRRAAAASLRAAGRHGIVLGLINAVIPFWLIAWGETHIDSGIAAIANSTVPIFVTLLAIRFRPSERARGQQMVGIVIGLVGVGVLVGVHPEGGWWAIAGTLAVVLSSVFYAGSNLYTQTHLTGTRPIVTATAALTTAAIVILPFGLLQVPSELPSAKALGATAALGIFGTAIAYLVLYRMIEDYGASRTSFVTYLMPAFALFYGAVFLGEAVRATAVLGLLLILAGVALGSGVAKLGRRSPAAAAP
jgi:drug/metabolite transporter (DMT)-like permease